MYAKVKKRKKKRGGFTFYLKDIPEEIQEGLICAVIYNGQPVSREIFNKIEESKMLLNKWITEKEKEKETSTIKLEEDEKIS